MFLLKIDYQRGQIIQIWISGPGLLDHIQTSIGGGGDSFGQGFSGIFGRQVLKGILAISLSFEELDVISFLERSLVARGECLQSYWGELDGHIRK